jgi:hypothetical protein
MDPNGKAKLPGGEGAKGLEKDPEKFTEIR